MVHVIAVLCRSCPLLGPELSRTILGSSMQPNPGTRNNVGLTTKCQKIKKNCVD